MEIPIEKKRVKSVLFNQSYSQNLVKFTVLLEDDSRPLKGVLNTTSFLVHWGVNSYSFFGEYYASAVNEAMFNLKRQNEIQAAKKVLESYGYINPIQWNKNDIREYRKEDSLTDDEIDQVAELLDTKHDCNVGINWEVIGIWLDFVLEKRPVL